MRSSRPVRARLLLSPIVFALAACGPLAPVAPPPHIRHTPGAAVVVTENSVDAGDFRLDYPPTWTVVKASQATEARLRLVFVAPDGGAVWLSQVESTDTAADELVVLPNGVILALSIEAAEAPSASFAPQARRLIASIRS